MNIGEPWKVEKVGQWIGSWKFEKRLKVEQG
jgi:hypothetical protein